MPDTDLTRMIITLIVTLHWIAVDSTHFCVKQGFCRSARNVLSSISDIAEDIEDILLTKITRYDYRTPQLYLNDRCQVWYVCTLVRVIL